MASANGEDFASLVQALRVRARQAFALHSHWAPFPGACGPYVKSETLFCPQRPTRPSTTANIEFVSTLANT